MNTLKSMAPKSSTDCDGISIKLLKKFAIELSYPLTHIFNLSLKNCIFPSKLKTSKIIPLHKAGSPELCDNYRPIALLSSISKTLEKIVANKLTQHIESNKLLYEGQFGFRKGRSTEQDLIRMTQFIIQQLMMANIVWEYLLILKKHLMSVVMKSS